jgi:serine protease
VITAAGRKVLLRAAGTLVLVTLVACGGGGGPAADASSAPAAGPSAQFTVSERSGAAPLVVRFDAAGSIAGGGAAASYHWEFGDGASSSGGPAATHTYTDTGSFTVTLEVVDALGASSTATRSVRVTGTRVSGVIRIAPGSSVDGDVNDRLTTPTANNSFGTAQLLRNPVRLGGFVNRPGSGSATGNFRDTGDEDDYYRVELRGGEWIVLSIGDAGADLDLELYRDGATPVLVDASVSVDATEDLTAPQEPGAYFIRVRAVSGASNYVLSVGENSALALMPKRAKRLSDPFVAGELLMTDGQAAEIRRYRIERGPRGRQYRLVGPGQAAAPGAAADITFAEVDLPSGSRATTAALDRYRTLIATKTAKASGAAGLAEVNVLRQPMRIPNDTFYGAQWHLRAIDLEAAWAISTGQDSGHPDVVVAVVDTGVLLDHPDLRDQWLRDADGSIVGYDFIQDPVRAGDGDGIDDDPADPGDGSRTGGGGSFHGTHVAGTIAAASDNGIGVAGVSWGARLMPLRALGVDGGTTYDVMQAVRYAARLSNASGTLPPVRADIINLSLGSDFYSEAEQRTLNQVRARGVFVVASAGNEGRDVPTYPASYDGVISVAATTSAGTRAAYSNFGPLVDLAAPGGDGVDRIGDGRPDGIASTIGTGGGDEPVEPGYGILQGTSMAAPHVSGVIALMKSVAPELTPAQFDNLLAGARLTDDAGTPGRNDHYGWGILNANRALQAALETAIELDGSEVPALSISSGTLDFQAFTQELDFAVSNVGGGSVTVTVTDDQPWLSVAALAASADGLGAYRATVDRTGLPEGTHTGTILISAADPAVAARSISVVVLVTSPDVDADAGQHYVILVDVDGEVTLPARVVNASGGEYRFDLHDVPPGRYQLFAGTDLNDDDFLCDGGEACGAYPSLADPAVITIDPRQRPEVSGLSFASEFRTTATTTLAAEAGPVGRARGLLIVRPPEQRPSEGTERGD